MKGKIWLYKETERALEKVSIMVGCPRGGALLCTTVAESGRSIMKNQIEKGKSKIFILIFILVFILNFHFRFSICFFIVKRPCWLP